jgi:hypothetical protein
MMDVPDFMWARVTERRCGRCKCHLTVEDVYRIGLCRGSPRDPSGLVIYLSCPRCQQENLRLAGDEDWVSLLTKVADWLWRSHRINAVLARPVRRRGRAARRADTPISDEEVGEIKQNLANANGRGEFMRALGLTPRDIQRYTKGEKDGGAA